MLKLVVAALNVLLAQACFRTVPVEPPTTTPIPTTAAPVCEAPNANSAPLTIDTGTTTADNSDFVNPAGPISSCGSCPVGTREFFNAVTDTSPSGAEGKMDAAAGFKCDDPADYCMCNTQGQCCTFPADARVLTVYMLSFCESAGDCSMYAHIFADTNADFTLTCDSGTFSSNDGTATFASGSYFKLDSVSCNGCDNIRQSQTCTP